jgi:FAD/FMN-containing dehydrogenase/Fe-S oxidoreductase
VAPDPALVDIGALAAELGRALEGDVRFDAGSRGTYASDGSHYRMVPLGVVVPRTVDDLIATVEICREHGAPITHRGGGTSCAGQTVNHAVIIDSSTHLDRITGIDPHRRTATVQPGLVLDDLRGSAAAYGLTFAPDPSTHNRCTLGGMIGNNACGVHSVRGGRTSDNVIALDVLLPDGTRMNVGEVGDEAALDAALAAGGPEAEILRALRDLRDRTQDAVRDRFPDIPRRVSGFNLDELLPENGFHVARALVGTEGTCVTVLGATVRLVDRPEATRLLVLGYPSIVEAADDAVRVRDAGCVGLEGIDHRLVGALETGGRHARELALLPEGRGWLMVEFGGESPAAAESQARRLIEELGDERPGPTWRLYDDPADERRIWTIRKAGLAAMTFAPDAPDRWTGWEDAAVAPERLGAYLRDFNQLMDEHAVDGALYGHVGDGCMHCRLSFDFTSTEGIAAYRRFVEDAAEVVLAHGGSFSGEHGDGRSRAELLPRMFGDELVAAFGAFKAIWDPDGMMNPGKVVDPQPLDDDLWLSPTSHPTDPPGPTWFAYPDDDRSFARAQTRCVGVGLCRRDDGAGTMCPSYPVTGEEQHSTRGRARLLAEMLRPDTDLDGWDDAHVREALDLCLSCKGCKVDCPVSVDVATYKAEFLAHHHTEHRRPITHYSLGLIDRWARLGALLPGVTNLVLGAPGIGALLKRAGGITHERPAPIFAAETGRGWLAKRPAADPDAPPVALFVDTFTDAFEPGVVEAAVTVLEDAGYRPVIPARKVCCGRPLYDHGLLGRARRYLADLVGTYGAYVAAGVPVVGLEPSCVATFRDELPAMLPDDEEAVALARHVRTLAEFLREAAYEPPQLRRRAVVHGHCHQKADLGLDAEGWLYDAVGLDWRELDAGCCGLAGAFGFEAGRKNQLSVRIGERRLLPAIRGAADRTLIIGDGFSCRTQIAHLQQRRRALHTAEVLVLAMRTGPGGPTDGRIEEGLAPPTRKKMTKRDIVALGLLGLAGVAGAIATGRRVR